jgi:peptidoglycan/xylan/chitin deacetylase (PgdA/CDA1 family)
MRGDARPTSPPAKPRDQRYTALGTAAFIAIVLAISLALVRDRTGIPARPASATTVGSRAAQGFIPVTRSPRLDGGGRAFTPVTRNARLDDPALTVTLVREPASVAYYNDVAEYDRALQRWSAALEATGVRVRVARPSELASDRSAAIVVPAAPCLSALTRNALLRAGNRGQGIIVTGLTGTRDAGCRDLGFGFLAELTGSARVDTIRSTAEAYITVTSASPLALDIPPGTRIELQPAPHVAVRRAGRTAYFSDRDLNPVGVMGSPLVDAALMYSLESGRRVVYFGFELGTVIDRPWERAMTALLVRNAVALAAGMSIASPDAWPNGHAAAAVMAQDVEDEFENAKHALDSLEAARVPGTFYLVSDLAERHPELVDRMAAAGEVGTHTENHATLGGPVEVQRQRLERTQAQLAKLSGSRVAGLRPPEEQFDSGTLLAWREAGGQYLFGANDGRSASPELVEVGGAPFVLIGRVVDDDFITVRRARISDPARLAADQLEAFDKVRSLGGLFVMSYHSNMLARPATVPALGIVARRLRADSTVWLTTAKSAASWWLGRHRLATSATTSRDGVVSVTVRNDGPTDVPTFGLLVTVPRGDLESLRGDGGAVVVTHGLMRVRVPELAPGASYSTSITLSGASRAR